MSETSTQNVLIEEPQKRGPGRPRKQQPEVAAPPAPAAAAAEPAPVPFDAPPAWACIGFPVQYTDRDGNVSPGFLQDQPRTDKTVWNVRVFPSTMTIGLVRTGVHYSPTPRPGCFSPVPGLVPTTV